MADTDLLDYAGLKHYDSKIKSCMWNWQKSKKNTLVQLKPIPESDLEPVVDFVLTETPPASGGKAPDNPSTITGVMQAKVTRCGKNICPLVGESSSSYISVSFTDNGEFVFNGSYAGLVDVYVFNKTYNINLFPDYLEQGKTYTFSLQGDNSLVTFHVFIYRATNYGGAVVSIAPGESQTYTIPDTQSMILRFSIPANTVLNNAKFKLQIEEGSSATEFEPYTGNDYTISLGNTYYGGSLDLATGVMTVTWEAYKCTGSSSEAWIIDTVNSTSTMNYFRGVPQITHMMGSVSAATRACTHFVYSSVSGVVPSFATWSQTPRIVFRLPSASFPDVATLTSWLVSEYDAGHPVTVAYALDQPYIVQLTPTQIRSLPALDKYEPRINTVYSDQEAVQVGYQRYADDPAPLWYVKDMMRAEVEAMTSGRNTVVRDKRGNPHIMVVVPKFRLSDIDSNWAAAVHPAFIVDGVEKSEILIGKYLASQDASGKVQTLPRQAPWTQVNFGNALTACRELGPNFCLNTNAMWAARVLWDYKRLGGSHVYLGNANYGRDYTYHELTGTLKSGTYLPGDTSLTDAATLTGTGGPLWNDDGTESGIADLVGNVWEWVGGFRLNNGEIQIIPNNDASLADCDMTAASTEWKAVLQDGTLVAPETADTLKFDSAYADASGIVGAPSLNTLITNSISTGYNNANFKSFAAAFGITVPVLLKQLAVFPVGNDLQGGLWSRNSGERLACRGGSWLNGLRAGPFALGVDYPRTIANRNVGFRAGFVS